MGTILPIPTVLSELTSPTRSTIWTPNLPTASMLSAPNKPRIIMTFSLPSTSSGESTDLHRSPSSMEFSALLPVIWSLSFPTFTESGTWKLILNQPVKTLTPGPTLSISLLLEITTAVPVTVCPSFPSIPDSSLSTFLATSTTKSATPTITTTFCLCTDGPNLKSDRPSFRANTFTTLRSTANRSIPLRTNTHVTSAI